MSTSTPGSTAWVFHRGALGDSVLVWPLLRALAASCGPVRFVTDTSKAALAARVLGSAVEPVSAETPAMNRLWSDDPGDAPGPLHDRGAALIVHLAPDPVPKAVTRWAANARRVFAGSRGAEPRVEIVAGVLDRRAALSLARRFGTASAGEVEHALRFTRLDGTPAGSGGAETCIDATAEVSSAFRSVRSGAIVLHVGAGSETKRWPMERWAAVASHLGHAGGRVEVVAGEVEMDRFARRDKALFEELRGRWIGTLDELAGVVGGARAFVGCDSGPAHLAGQLGVPTLALFGPTDPEAWAPIGPRVSVMAPPGGVTLEMQWLTPDAVCRAVGVMLHDSGRGSGRQ